MIIYSDFVTIKEKKLINNYKKSIQNFFTSLPVLRKKLLLGEGLKSKVYKYKDRIAVKYAKKEYKEEFNILSDLYIKGVNVVRPLAYDSKRNKLFVEEIVGYNMYKAIEYLEPNYVDDVFFRLLDMSLDILKKGYKPSDLHADNIIYSNGEIIIIDVDRFQNIDTNFTGDLCFIKSFGEKYYSLAKDYIEQKGFSLC